MKLDWCLIRTILAHVEAETIEEFLQDADSLFQWKEGQFLSKRLKEHQDSAQRVVLRHVKLLISAGYVENIEIKESVDGYLGFACLSEPALTFDGYSLLEFLREDNFIKKLKKYAKEKDVPLTIENVIELAKISLPALVQMD
ncbi:DUF2513 domain-containing protein [uncultured Parasutterella sp.]|uniref:DUF2513 domain-containing protein n=1 Tax=uncultured Parasutterella sp. TaxID=1263098 RepID=UPI0025B74C98|nr:DUF2513 domain-containing protein [uncultured Parasutterella sp.]